MDKEFIKELVEKYYLTVFHLKYPDQIRKIKELEPSIKRFDRVYYEILMEKKRKKL